MLRLVVIVVVLASVVVIHFLGDGLGNHHLLIKYRTISVIRLASQILAALISKYSQVGIQKLTVQTSSHLALILASHIRGCIASLMTTKRTLNDNRLGSHIYQASHAHQGALLHLLLTLLLEALFLFLELLRGLLLSLDQSLFQLGRVLEALIVTTQRLVYTGRRFELLESIVSHAE